MSTSLISAAGLGQAVLSSSVSPLQQALQTLQSSLSTGNLTSAASAFQTLQTVLQDSATASGSTLAGNSQLSADLTALGSALSSGNVSTAQSAFATVLGDLKTSATPAQINEASAASQSLQLVQELLGTVDGTSTAATTTAATTSLLQSVYGAQSGLNVFG
jgi:hypothetical protein